MKPDDASTVCVFLILFGLLVIFFSKIIPQIMCAYDLRYFRLNYNQYSDVEDIPWLLYWSCKESDNVTRTLLLAEIVFACGYISVQLENLELHVAQLCSLVSTQTALN